MLLNFIKFVLLVLVLKVKQHCHNINQDMNPPQKYSLTHLFWLSFYLDKSLFYLWTFYFYFYFGFVISIVFVVALSYQL